MKTSRRVAVVWLTAGLALSMAFLSSGANAAASQAAGNSSTSQVASEHWTSAWSAAPQAVSTNPAAPAFNRSPELRGKTVRQIVYLRLSGDRVRVRLSNVFGAQPLSLDHAALGISLAGSAALRAGSQRPLLFGGKTGVTVAAGSSVVSDPVDLPLRAGEPLAISLYSARDGAASTWHKIASQVNTISGPGDYSMDGSADAFHQRITNYVWLDGVDLASTSGPKPPVAVAAIGDSITDGMRSSLNRNQRWPDLLSRRLTEVGATNLSVVNLGISGNRLLSDSPCYGESLLGRFERDALGQNGVRAAIVLIGINDINFAAMAPHAGLDCDFPHTSVTAAQLTGGYQRLVAEAHAHGVKIFLATLTPAALPPGREALRQAVNQWIRGAHGADGLIDFDAALRDPAHPERLLPRLDSGDGIHPSDAGYSAMAGAVELPLLQSLTAR